MEIIPFPKHILTETAAIAPKSQAKAQIIFQDVLLRLPILRLL